MRIKSIHLKKVGVFENETIEFKPCPAKNKAEIHIFTGTNGSGKSTILQALAFTEYFRRRQEYLPANTFNERYRNNAFGKTFRKKLNTELLVSYEYLNGNLDFGITKDEFFAPEVKKKYIRHTGIATDDDVERYNDKYLNSLMTDFAFAYSGYRFVDHEENINIAPKKNLDILKKSLQFQKEKDDHDISLNQWLANKISQRNSAAYEGDKKNEKKYGHNIEIIKSICEEIIGYPIDFKFKHEELKVTVVQDEKELDFDLLPDGLRSILSWLGDLVMRMDQLVWKDDLPILERSFLLLLDEIEVHLHPYWQMRVLPVIQSRFPNAQIFISTHSPFVVNSVDDAWVYNLDVEKGNAKVKEPELSQDGKSITSILRNTFGVKETFGIAVEKDLKIFRTLMDKALDKSISGKEQQQLYKVAEKLAAQGTETASIVGLEMRQLERLNKKEMAL